MDHLPGHPISAATYQRHGCRCDGCTEAKTLNVRRTRARTRRRAPASDKASSRARRLSLRYVQQHHPEAYQAIRLAYPTTTKRQTAAAGFLRFNHPDRYQQLLSDSYAHFQSERRAPGRPKQETAR